MAEHTKHPENLAAVRASKPAVLASWRLIGFARQSVSSLSTIS